MKLTGRNNYCAIIANGGFYVLSMRAWWPQGQNLGLQPAVHLFFPAICPLRICRFKDIFLAQDLSCSHLIRQTHVIVKMNIEHPRVESLAVFHILSSNSPTKFKSVSYVTVYRMYIICNMVRFDHLCRTLNIFIHDIQHALSLSLSLSMSKAQPLCIRFA